MVREEVAAAKLAPRLVDGAQERGKVGRVSKSRFLRRERHRRCAQSEQEGANVFALQRKDER